MRIMEKAFIPAARFESLTIFYDPFVRLFFWNTRKRIIQSINPKQKQKLLDVGCGTGILIEALKRTEPSLDITGLDIDPKILKIAKKKFKKKNIDVKFVEASATEIPIEEKFDIIISTLMFHHLDSNQKTLMLSEVYAHLNDNGKFYLYDFGIPSSRLGKFVAGIWRHAEPLIDEGTEGTYESMLKKANFKNTKSVFRSFTFELFSAEK